MYKMFGMEWENRQNVWNGVGEWTNKNLQETKTDSRLSWRRKLYPQFDEEFQWRGRGKLYPQIDEEKSFN